MHWRAEPEQMCCENSPPVATTRPAFQTRKTIRPAAPRAEIPETPRSAALVISNYATLALRRRMKKHDREKAVLPHRPEPRSLANLCGVQRVWQRKTDHIRGWSRGQRDAATHPSSLPAPRQPPARGRRARTQTVSMEEVYVR